MKPLTFEKISPLGKQRYWIVAFCFLAYVVAYMDRSNIGVLIAYSGFTRVLGITNDKAMQGSLMSVFLICYGACSFLAGPVVQRFGPKKSLFFGLLSWAVMTVVMGVVSSTLIFVICRGLLGISESVLSPGVSSLIQAWFPLKERSTANGIWYTGIKIAQIIATPVFAWWIYMVGWRGSFYLLALVGLIPVCFVCYVYNHPSQSPKITNEEAEYIINGGGAVPANATKMDFSFLKNLNFWCISVIFAIANSAIWGFVSWVPSYLKGTLGFSWEMMGSLAALPYISATVSVLLICPLMDKYNRRAIFSMICCAMFAVTLMIAMTTESRIVAVAVLSLALAFGSIVTPASVAMVQNITDQKQVASASGFLTGIAYVFASITPYGMGLLYNITGTLKSGFIGLSALIIIGFLLCIPLVRQRL